ncbi:MAG: hypothetical protein ABUK01_18820, partial [Leptospirales bacterium]
MKSLKSWKIFFVVFVLSGPALFLYSGEITKVDRYYDLFVNEWSNPSSMYDKMPDPSRGKAGVLKDSEKKLALKMTNAIRDLHNLPPVQYKKKDDIYTAKSCLIMAANRKMTHYPPKNSK